MLGRMRRMNPIRSNGDHVAHNFQMPRPGGKATSRAVRTPGMLSANATPSSAVSPNGIGGAT